MRILIVEDEDALANGLAFNFELEGYDAVVARDGPAAQQLFETADPPFDLVILDLMLPGMSGYEVCKAIRAKNALVPIMVLSARTLSEDKTYAFDCGTDMYVTKPFALPELLSRVRRVRKRSEPGTSVPVDEYRFADVHVDFRKFAVSVRGSTHVLTTLEMQLLRYFIEHPGIVLSRTRILEDVWGQGAGVTTRTVDQFVLRLRKILEADPGEPRYILSVRGTGYRFMGDSFPVTPSK